MRTSGATQVVGGAAPQGAIRLGTQHVTVALAGLMLYLFVVHSYKAPLAAVAIGIGLLGVLSSSGGLRLHTPVLAMLAWVGWCAATWPLSDYQAAVGDGLADFLKIALIFVVATNALRTMPQLLIFVGTWIAMFVLFPFRGQLVYRLIGNTYFGRVGWNYAFANFNDFAAYDILLFCLAIFAAFSPVRPLFRRLAFAAAGAAALSFVLTQSRGCLIAVGLIFPFYVLRSRQRRKVLIGTLLLSLAVVLASPKTVWNRLTDIALPATEQPVADQSEAASSATQRWMIANVAWSIFRDNPLTGVGVEAYPKKHSLYADSRAEWSFARGERDAHNLYLLLLAETGVVGAALFLAMIASAILVAMRAESRLRSPYPVAAEQLRILRFGLVAYMVAATFGTYHRVSFLYLYVAVLLAASALLMSPERALTGQSSATLVPARPGRRRSFPAARPRRLAVRARR